MDDSLRKIVHTLKSSGLYHFIDRLDSGAERVLTGFRCDLDGKDLKVVITFVYDEGDYSPVSLVHFTFDGKACIRCSDFMEGLKVCNRLNNIQNLFYSFFVNEKNHEIGARCVFPRDVDEGRFAAVLYEQFKRVFREHIVGELAKCMSL